MYCASSEKKRNSPGVALQTLSRRLSAVSFLQRLLAERGMDNARIAIGKHTVRARLRHPFDDHGILVADVWNYLNPLTRIGSC